MRDKAGSPRRERQDHRFDDPDCGGPFDTSEAPGCDNGLDDDGDGLVDLKDPGCFGDRRGAERRPQCADGVDNDGDGLVDAKDPNCGSDADETEAAACAEGWTTTATG